jgi:hypothetical protein
MGEVEQAPPERPRKISYTPRLRTILIATAIFLMYLSSLWMAITEASRRSVSLAVPPQGADHMIMNVNVVYVDLLRSEMTTRISFHLDGQLAQDEATPATDSQLVLNTVHGQQQFDFPKGQRINPIEAVFPLKGEVNFYPFDHHTGVLWLLVTFPQAANGKSKPAIAPANTVPPNIARQEPAKPHGLFPFLNRQEPDNVPNEIAESPSLPVGSSALQQREQADTGTNFTASITGLTFRDSLVVQSTQNLKGLTGIQVDLRRSSNVIMISVTSMLMMAALAVALVSMVLKIVSGGRRMANFHVPMAVSLIFGLPALRNVQPGIPPIGTFGDTVAFTWAEVAAAGSAITLVIHWILHRTTPAPPQEPD